MAWPSPALRIGRFAQRVQVGDVLRASRRTLRRRQLRAPQKRDEAIAHAMLETPLPRLVEVWHPAQPRHEIDAQRWHSELDHDVRTSQILARQLETMSGSA